MLNDKGRGREGWRRQRRRRQGGVVRWLVVVHAMGARGRKEGWPANSGAGVYVKAWLADLAPTTQWVFLRCSLQQAVGPVYMYILWTVSNRRGVASARQRKALCGGTPVWSVGSKGIARGIRVWFGRVGQQRVVPSGADGRAWCLIAAALLSVVLSGKLVVAYGVTCLPPCSALALAARIACLPRCTPLPLAHLLITLNVATDARATRNARSSNYNPTNATVKPDLVLRLTHITKCGALTPWRGINLGLIQK